MCGVKFAKPYHFTNSKKIERCVETCLSLFPLKYFFALFLSFFAHDTCLKY